MAAMDATSQFLWDRRRVLRDRKKSRDWAIALLEAGQESDAILRLAGITDETWHLERELVTHILRDIGKLELLNNDTFYDAFEQEAIADYYAGLIDGPTLIDHGCEIYYERDEKRRKVFWIALADDAGQHGGQGICGKYRFDQLPYDVALQQALADHGFPNPGIGK
jgi:hypothetical protein